MIHGTNTGYRNGCRCAPCHRAFRDRQNRLRRERGGLVPAEPSARHIRRLSDEFGIGLPTIFLVTGISTETLFHVKHGVRLRVRKATEAAILSIGPGHRRRFTEREPYMKKIEALLAEGFTPTELARRLGYSNTTALNLNKYNRVTQAKAKKIVDFYDMIMAGA